MHEPRMIPGRRPAAHLLVAGRRVTRMRFAGAVWIAALVALAGCHDEQRIREQLEPAKPARLPVEPDEPNILPTPALLDTIKAYRSPDVVDTTGWQLVRMDVGDHRLWYRVPLAWRTSGDGQSENRGGLVQTRATATALDSETVSLATYAAQLAEGSPIERYTTAEGLTVYVTVREISVAPSDPNAPREIFHTAVTDVDGRIIKLDVRYQVSVDWRFVEVAEAIVGTVDVRRSDD